MARLRVPYETVSESGVFLNLEVPNKNLKVQFIPQEPKPVSDLERTVREAIESPVEGRSFSISWKKKKSVTFIVENQFRAAPAHAILPILVEKAKQASCEISIVIGNAALPSLSSKRSRKNWEKPWFNLESPFSAMKQPSPIDYHYIGITKAGTPLFVVCQAWRAGLYTNLVECGV